MPLDCPEVLVQFGYKHSSVQSIVIARVLLQEVKLYIVVQQSPDFEESRKNMNKICLFVIEHLQPNGVYILYLLVKVMGHIRDITTQHLK